VPKEVRLSSQGKATRIVESSKVVYIRWKRGTAELLNSERMKER
jgi:hypothetical protein